MKKIFGTLVTSENPEGIFYIQESLYKKISKKFDEFFIINLINFNLFKKKKNYTKIKIQIIYFLITLK